VIYRIEPTSMTVIHEGFDVKKQKKKKKQKAKAA
jgi:hypothetical protein